MARSQLSLDAYSDRELVHLVADLGDEDGWVTVLTFRRKVGLAAEHQRSVVARFSWMKRFGIMERSKEGLWRLSKEGREMVWASEQHNRAANMIAGLQDAQLVWVSHTLAGRFQAAKTPHATMTRREWQREFKRRSS